MDDQREPHLDEVFRILAQHGLPLHSEEPTSLAWQGQKNGLATWIEVDTRPDLRFWSMSASDGTGRGGPIDLYELGTGRADPELEGLGSFDQLSARDIAGCLLLVAHQLSDNLIVPEGLFRRSALLSEMQSMRNTYYTGPVAVGCEHLVISTCSHEPGEWHCGRELHYIQQTLFALNEWREATVAVHRPVTLSTFERREDFEAHVTQVRHLLDTAVEANNQQAQEAAEMAASKRSYGQVFWDAFTGKTTGPMQGHRLYRNVRRRR